MSNDLFNAAASREAQMEAVTVTMSDLTISFGQNAMDTPAAQNNGLELALQAFQMSDMTPETTTTYQKSKNPVSGERKATSTSNALSSRTTFGNATSNGGKDRNPFLVANPRINFRAAPYRIEKKKKRRQKIPSKEADVGSEYLRHLDREPILAVLVCFDVRSLTLRNDILRKIVRIFEGHQVQMAYSWQFNVDAKRIAKRKEICMLYETKDFVRVEFKERKCRDAILEKWKRWDDTFRVVEYYPGWVQAKNGDWYVPGKEDGSRGDFLWTTE